MKHELHTKVNLEELQALQIFFMKKKKKHITYARICSFAISYLYKKIFKEEEIKDEQQEDN